MLPSFYIGRSLFLNVEGDPSGNGDKKKKSENFKPDISDEELKIKVDALVATQAAGDLKQALAILQKDNARVRNINRNARVQIDKMTELSDSDKILLEATKKAKFTVETIPTTVARLKELETKTSEQAFENIVQEAAKILGVNHKVLTDQLKLGDQHLELREIHVEVPGKNGKEGTVELKKVPHVRSTKDDKAPLTPASTWMKTLSIEYQAALKAKVADGTEKKESTTSFTRYPDQPAGDKVPDGKRAVDAHLQATYGRMPDIPGVINPTKPATTGA